MSHVENQWDVVAGLLHDPKTEHVDHEVVVAKIAAAFAQQQLLVAALFEFFNDVGHLFRA